MTVPSSTRPDDEDDDDDGENEGDGGNDDEGREPAPSVSIDVIVVVGQRKGALVLTFIVEIHCFRVDFDEGDVARRGIRGF